MNSNRSEETTASLANLLRQAKKRSLEVKQIHGTDDGDANNNSAWRSVAGDLPTNWCSEKVVDCLNKGEIPHSAFPELVDLAVEKQDLDTVDALLSSSYASTDIGDGSLVNALLLAVRRQRENESSNTNTVSQHVLQSVFHRSINPSSVISSLRRSSSLADCLTLLESAIDLLSGLDYNESDLTRRKATLAWVGALLDSHFFGFVQRLGFNTGEQKAAAVAENGSGMASDKIKGRLEEALDKLLSFVDDQTAAVSECNALLTLVESSLAQASNTMPSANRYRQEQGKTHREYAVRLISL